MASAKFHCGLNGSGPSSCEIVFSGYRFKSGHFMRRLPGLLHIMTAWQKQVPYAIYMNENWIWYFSKLLWHNILSKIYFIILCFVPFLYNVYIKLLNAVVRMIRYCTANDTVITYMYRYIFRRETHYLIWYQKFPLYRRQWENFMYIWLRESLKTRMIFGNGYGGAFCFKS